jgi:cytochrome c biogenesis protein CcdA
LPLAPCPFPRRGARAREARVVTIIDFQNLSRFAAQAGTLRALRQAMKEAISVFIGMYATLLAIINPLEALPVFLSLLAGKDRATQRSVARRSCLYATGLMFFFLIFGTLICTCSGSR